MNIIIRFSIIQNICTLGMTYQLYLYCNPHSRDVSSSTAETPMREPNAGVLYKTSSIVRMKSGIRCKPKRMFVEWKRKSARANEIERTGCSL